MTSSSWRIVICAILLILQVQESVAGKISSSRRARHHGYRRHIRPVRLRAHQANEVDNSGGHGGNRQASTTPRSSSWHPVLLTTLVEQQWHF